MTPWSLDSRPDVLFYLPSVSTVIAPGAGPPGGGAEVQMVLVARGLARLGASVCMAAFNGPAGLPETVDGVRIVARSPYRARDGRTGRLREAAEIHSTLAKADAKLVVMRGAAPTVGLTALSAKLQGRRFVYSSANLADFDIRRMDRKRSNAAMFHLGLRLADEIVVQTEEQKDLCERRFGRTPILIKSTAEVTEPRSGRPEAFIWAGRIVSYKQPLAFVELARAVPEAKFWLVGMPEEGEDRRRLLEQVRAAAQALPNLELHDACPREELMRLMDRAVAVVNTADFEGLSNTFLEGWARGVPALSLSHDPDRLIQRFGLGGFAGGSPSRLASLARELWHQRDDQRDLAERCRRYVTREHDPERVYADWLRALGLGSPVPAVEPAMAGAL